MGVVEAILAVLGVVFVGLIVWAALWGEAPTVIAPPEDLAAPYREGLHAAVRMQRVAADLEQQIYAEAAKQFEDSETEAS
jgi:hypothetical protein